MTDWAQLWRFHVDYDDITRACVPGSTYVVRILSNPSFPEQQAAPQSEPIGFNCSRVLFNADGSVFVRNTDTSLVAFDRAARRYFSLSVADLDAAQDAPPHRAVLFVCEPPQTPPFS